MQQILEVVDLLKCSIVLKNRFYKSNFDVGVLTKGLNTDENSVKIVILKLDDIKNFVSSHILVLACWLFSMDGSQHFGS